MLGAVLSASAETAVCISTTQALALSENQFQTFLQILSQNVSFQKRKRTSFSSKRIDICSAHLPSHWAIIFSLGLCCSGLRTSSLQISTPSTYVLPLHQFYCHTFPKIKELYGNLMRVIIRVGHSKSSTTTTTTPMQPISHSLMDGLPWESGLNQGRFGVLCPES